MALVREDFIEVEAIMAVAAVESKGGGFDPEGFPKTLFEGHWFHKLTGGKFSAAHPRISYAKWTKIYYGKTWREEKDRLAKAIQLDRNAALQSASWGMFQIMGFNYGQCGFTSVQQFVNAMCKGEKSQLEIFTAFLMGYRLPAEFNGLRLSDLLRDRRWADFARVYNGPEYAKNKYDQKLEAAYNKFKQEQL